MRHDFKADRSAGAATLCAQWNTWSEQAFIKASNSGANDWFGSRSALSGDGNTAAFGASLEDSSGRGVDGKQDDDKASESGAVYFFRRNGTTWSQQHFVKAANADAYDEFGGSVALSRDGRTMVVAAHSEDSSSRGVGGNQADNGSAEAGAAYVFSATDRSGRWIVQKSIFIANCIILESPDDVMRPKVALDSVCLDCRAGTSKALNASTRASILCPFVKRNERTSERSTCCRPGPSYALRTDVRKCRAPAARTPAD